MRARVRQTIAAFAVAAALLCAVVPLPALAQGTLNDTIAGKTQKGSGTDRLLVDAKEIVYNNDRNTVSASGDVQLNYQGRTLQADRVIYDRNTGRVRAEGNARLTEANGSVITGDQFELTDDFKSGFIDSLRVVQSSVERGRPLTTRFSAPRAERSEGETTVFERGTYTACEPCKEHPERPPFWQVRAARIIHNNSERTIYYENATLELAGIPVAYLPYFWTPDPTVKRKTGFLAPRYIASNTLGTGASLPFFWAVAPNYDLTLTPSYLSRQGVLGQAEWRHRLLTGSYNIRASGIIQQDPEAFLPSPSGAGDRTQRGSLESTGLFHINDRWKWGWDVALLSDKYFLQNYRIRSESLSELFYRESISSLYLTGQGDRSWFDVRGYYFQGLSSNDWQKQQPVVHPVLDYDKRINGPSFLGGEITVEANATSLTREAAQYQQIPVRGPLLFGLYETCTVFERGVCLVRGISGTASRASLNVSWRRTFIDGAGQSWTPFMFMRADGFSTQPDFTGFQNPELRNFLNGDGDELAGRAMPGVGLEYRFPFVASFGESATQVLEPIGQIIARPSETKIGHIPNEDAQSLVFEDTSIFEWNKFSGYDRVEGGVRTNLGLQYSIHGNEGFYANALVGQSIHLAGLNSFSKGDLVNTGLDSGLESSRSDYVTRLQFSPNSRMSFVTRGRFDQDDLSMRRFEAIASADLNPWLPMTTSVTYARYLAQPELGYPNRREGVLASARVNVTDGWYVSGSVLVDLDRYLDARQFRRQDEIKPNSITLGLGYMDECTTFNVAYSMTPREVSGTYGEKDRNQTILLSLELRTLGQASIRQRFEGTNLPNTQDR